MKRVLTRRALLAFGAAAAITGCSTSASKRVRISHPNLPAGASGTIWIGGDLQVNRIGLGTAEFTGPERWGDPSDPAAIRAVLRRAVELGVNLFDTADVYGPGVAERLIHEALYPYASDLVISTKGGQTHDVRGQPNGYDARPEQLRAACEGSLKRLGLEQIALYYLHSPDPKVPYADSVGELTRLQKEGKIRHIGVSNVDAAHLATARSIATVVAVQNAYNILSRKSDDFIALCEREKMMFIPNGPLGRPTGGRTINADDARLAGLEALAKQRQIDLPRAMLAWVLARSPVTMVIPGTTRVDHLEDDVGAAAVHFSKEEMQKIG